MRGNFSSDGLSQLGIQGNVKLQRHHGTQSLIWNPRSGLQHGLPGGGSEAVYRTYFSVIIGSGTKKRPDFENGAINSTKKSQGN